MPSVRDLIDAYGDGKIEYPQLLQALATHEYSDPTDEERQKGGNSADRFDQAEIGPDENSFFWIEAATDDDTLTHDQADEIWDAIDMYHEQGGGQ